MKPENYDNKYETKLRIEHFSIAEMVYGAFSGAAGIMAIEKFIEGRYTIAIVNGTIGAACGIVAYIANRNINNNARGLSERVDFYRNIAMAKHMPSENIVKNPEQDLERICEDNKGATILQFRTTLRRTKDE